MSIFSTLFCTSHKVDFSGITDWHCHILPGVDDGVETKDDALSILSEYERMGIEKVWLTPHIMEDFPNSTSQLRNRFAELKEHYNGNIRLDIAAEHMIDNLFSERLDADDILPIGDKQNMILVETSYFNPPLKFYNTLERIKSKGYYPLLAHPERYAYMNSMSEYEKLKDMGVLFQLNLLSLTGYYGRDVKEKSYRMLKRGMYDTFGTDLHRLKQLEILNQLSLSPRIIALVQSIRARLK